MNSNWFKLIMRATKVKYGKDLLLKGIPVIFNKSGAKIVIGDGVSIKSSFLSNLIGLYQRTIIVTRTPGAQIIIGNNVGISGATIYARKSITIGDNTAIGGNTKIIDNDFHPIELEARNKLAAGKKGPDDNELIGTRPIKIGKNCFIGCNSIILKGTVLADGCVVGAGAVVSGKFEEKNCVIAGNPARVIKKLKG
ncbi:acyltransferase [Sporolactobacillus kofuensis]|uniref:Acyltransferase n=1 Tax=Sporolactobacillus kofuensis TaxID=269672 RepID=A0ABW1WJ23_9BACL|nr:acyltransferase [Sporolactobacillus kofuensis]MCO7177094.1 acyltransferase [Sporolactobacillus kofuensis]